MLGASYNPIPQSAKDEATFGSNISAQLSTGACGSRARTLTSSYAIPVIPHAYTTACALPGSCSASRRIIEESMFFKLGNCDLSRVRNTPAEIMLSKYAPDGN